MDVVHSGPKVTLKMDLRSKIQIQIEDISHPKKQPWRLSLNLQTVG